MRDRYLLKGLLAAFALLLFYFLVMAALGSSLRESWQQFKALWWAMVPLSGGFGTQVALYSKLKDLIKRRLEGSIVAGGASASIGMVACCAHHLTDALPLIGLAGTSIFLAKYQVPILLASLLINALGIGLMLRHLRQMETK